MSQPVSGEKSSLPLVPSAITCESCCGVFRGWPRINLAFPWVNHSHSHPAAAPPSPRAYARSSNHMDWRSQAACLTEDPELFFPIGNTGPALVQIDEAKAVCRRCDVVETCLKWALESGQDAGVWGGMSEDERRALKRRTARAGERRVGQAAGDTRRPSA